MFFCFDYEDRYRTAPHSVNASPTQSGVPLLRGRMGRAGSSVAVRVEEAIERTDASRAL